MIVLVVSFLKLIFWDSKDGLWRHCVEWDKPEKDTYLYVESKKQKIWTPRKRDQTCSYQRWIIRGGRIGGRWSKGTDFHVQDT